MKHSFGIAASLLALAAAGAAFAADEKKISRNLELAGFDRIEISGVYEVDIKVGPAFSIALSGEEHEMDRVEASVKNGALKLGQRDWNRGEKRRNNQHGIEAVITMPSLAGFEVSGVVEGDIVGIDASHFELRLSGVGDLDIDGECDDLDAQVSGVGDLDARGLECRIVDIQVSGVGDATVFASEEIDAQVSGMGDIEVYGSPKRVSKSSGMFSEVTIH